MWLQSSVNAPGAHPQAGRMIFFLTAKKNSLDKMINNVLASGAIHIHTLSLPTPVLTTRKKDGNLQQWFCYQNVNNITVKDRYSLHWQWNWLIAPGQDRGFKLTWFHHFILEHLQLVLLAIWNHLKYESFFLLHFSTYWRCLGWDLVQSPDHVFWPGCWFWKGGGPIHHWTNIVWIRTKKPSST